MQRDLPEHKSKPDPTQDFIDAFYHDYVKIPSGGRYALRIGRLLDARPNPKSYDLELAGLSVSLSSVVMISLSFVGKQRGNSSFWLPLLTAGLILLGALIVVVRRRAETVRELLIWQQKVNLTCHEIGSSDTLSANEKAALIELLYPWLSIVPRRPDNPQ